MSASSLPKIPQRWDAYFRHVVCPLWNTRSDSLAVSNIRGAIGLRMRRKFMPPTAVFESLEIVHGDGNEFAWRRVIVIISESFNISGWRTARKAKWFFIIERHGSQTQTLSSYQRKGCLRKPGYDYDPLRGGVYSLVPITQMLSKNIAGTLRSHAVAHLVAWSVTSDTDDRNFVSGFVISKRLRSPMVVCLCKREVTRSGVSC